jgi:hypothetical protein
MTTLIRLLRVLALLVLTAVAVSLVTAMARPETGVLEKAVMVAMFVGVVAAAARVSSLALALQGRLRHH